MQSPSLEHDYCFEKPSPEEDLEAMKSQIEELQEKKKNLEKKWRNLELKSFLKIWF